MNIDRVRELTSYDIARDWIYIRWDVKIKGGEQFLVQKTIKPENGSINSQRNELRAAAIDELSVFVGSKETILL